MIKFSNKVLVSDPCYEYTGEHERYIAVLKNVKAGNWQFYTKYDDNRISHLIVMYEDIKPEYVTWYQMGKEIGVDSGQCGIYDLKSVKDVIGKGKYDDLNTWYGKACSLTYNEEEHEFLGNEIDGIGAVSSAGWGDGTYNLSVAYENDEIVGIKIIYLYNDDLDSEWADEYEDSDWDEEYDDDEESYDEDDEEDEDEIPDYDEEDDSDLD